MVADIPPAVMQIAQRVPGQEMGVVMYRLRRTFDVHAGPMHRHDELELVLVSQDGRTVKVRVVRSVVGGKAADAAGRADIENQYEHPNASDVFRWPFDPRYVAEYSFQVVDPHAYRFSSSIHDTVHGSGVFSTDAAGNVVHFQYTPNVLPKYTSSGTVTDERSEVLPKYWFLTSETYEYSGHYAIFGGGASVLIQYDQFKRFADLPSALSALDAPGM